MPNIYTLNQILRSICLFMLMPCSPLFSQSISIIGQILDSKTNEPLPFVSIYIDHSNQITTSDFNGNFHLHNILLNDKIKRYTSDINHMNLQLLKIPI